MSIVPTALADRNTLGNSSGVVALPAPAATPVSSTWRRSPASIEHDHRYRDIPTETLLAERESRQWDVAEIIADLERDHTSWDYPDQTLTYALTAFEDVDCEIERRERLRTSPGAPRWPQRNEQWYEDLKALAADLKVLWPIERFFREMLLADVQPAGQRFLAACPFPDHPDASPSCSIGPAPEVWYCHGCHRGGDVFTLVGMLRGLDTVTEQVRLLADVAGLTDQEAHGGQ